MIGGMVLAAPGEDSGFHDADGISRWIEDYDDDEESSWRSFILASPGSDRLAALLVMSLLARADGSMKNAHIIFVGTLAEGEKVIEAVTRSGAKISVVDRPTLFPPGEPLPQTPPPHWMPSPPDLGERKLRRSGDQPGTIASRAAVRLRQQLANVQIGSNRRRRSVARPMT